METNEEIKEYAIQLFTNEKGRIKTEILLIAGICLLIGIINHIKLILKNR